MDIKKALKRQYPLPGLIGVERITMIYLAFTLILSLFYIGVWEDPTSVYVGRLLIVVGTLALWRLYVWYPCNATYWLRVVFQIALLAYWYPDIYNFSRVMPDMDHIFALFDQQMFGCQPSIMLSQWLPGFFWRELFNMGYFSYYLMIIAIVVWATFVHYRRFDRTTTIVLCSFLFYYLIFLFIESAGPQFYFHKIGMADAMSGQFDNVGDWFRTSKKAAVSLPLSSDGRRAASAPLQPSPALM